MGWVGLWHKQYRPLRTVAAFDAKMFDHQIFKTMRTRIFITAFFAALLCCSFSLSAQDRGKKPRKTFWQKVGDVGRTIEKGTEIVKPVVEVMTDEEEAEPTEEENSEAQTSNEESPKEVEKKPSTASKAPKTINQKTSSGGQTSGSATLSPGASKTANINGASTSLSNSMDDYTLKVTGCKGSKSDQTVTIYFSVQHGLADQYLAVRASRCKAFAGGTDYSKFATKVGSKNNNNTVPYEVEINCEATIKFVPPSVQSFESVSVDLYTKNKGSSSGTKTGKLELRNLKVAWQ